MFTQANMLVLKLTRDCNLRCSYCYVRNKDNYKGEIIDFDLFKSIVDRVVKEKTKGNAINETFSLIFHGGEPLLAGPENLAKMLGYARKQFLDNNIKHEFGIQTNLTLLTPQVAQVLHEYDVSIGISFDGFSNGSMARSKILTDKFFINKINMMKEYNLTWGPLLVANITNYKKIKKSVHYLETKYSRRAVKVNYVEDVNTKDKGSEITGRQFFEYSFKPFIDDFIAGKKILETNSYGIMLQFFKHSIYLFEDTFKSNCYSKFCGGGINIIEIEPTGKVFLCGRYSENYDESFIENVTDKDFLDLTQIKAYIDFCYKKHKLIKQTGCDLCPADLICDHGCMAFYKSKFGTYGIRTDIVCDMFKPAWEYMITHEDKIISEFLKRVSKGELEVNFDINKKHILRGMRHEIMDGYIINIDEKNGKLLVAKKEKK